MCVGVCLCVPVCLRVSVCEFAVLLLLFWVFTLVARPPPLFFESSASPHSFLHGLPVSLTHVCDCMRAEVMAEYTHVATVHCETSSGLLNDVEGIGRAIKGANPDAVFVLDSASGAGGVEFAMENAGVGRPKYHPPFGPAFCRHEICQPRKRVVARVRGCEGARVRGCEGASSCPPLRPG